MVRKWLNTCTILVIYAAVSALILAFAQGYTVDLGSQQVVTTGVLEIDSFPSQAQVLLNQKLVDDVTPMSLTHYLPGVYEVKVKAEGYEPTILNAQVQSQLVTHLKEIPLWPLAQNWEKMALSDRIVETKALLKSGLLLIHTTKESSWWHVKAEALEKVISIPSEPGDTIVCSDDGQVCLLEAENQTTLVDLVSKNTIVLKSFVSLHDDDVLFRFHGDYFLLDKQDRVIALQKIDALGNVSLQMNLSDIDAFALKGQELWYVQNSILYQRSLISGLKMQVIAMPLGKVDQLLVNNHYIAWHAIDGTITIASNPSGVIVNVWAQAQMYAADEQLLVVSDAKVWSVDAAGIRFIGQAPHRVLAAVPYTGSSWLATMENGQSVFILLSPLTMQVISSVVPTTVVLPYQVMVQWHDKVLLYHVYPQKSWLSLLRQ